jgi:hypothetical protein
MSFLDLASPKKHEIQTFVVRLCIAGSFSLYKTEWPFSFWDPGAYDLKCTFLCPCLPVPNFFLLVVEKGLDGEVSRPWLSFTSHSAVWIAWLLLVRRKICFFWSYKLRGLDQWFSKWKLALLSKEGRDVGRMSTTDIFYITALIHLIHCRYTYQFYWYMYQ